MTYLFTVTTKNFDGFTALDQIIDKLEKIELNSKQTMRLFAVKVNCPELYKAVEQVGIRYGYKSDLRNINNPYIGFYTNKMDTVNDPLSINMYPQVFDGATQFDQFIEELEEIKKESKKRWKIGCSTVRIENKYLVVDWEDGNNTISFDVVKEIYNELKKVQ